MSRFWERKQLEEASPDLLRAMVKEMAEALMGAEADAVCGATYGERSPERVNRRNGYRGRDWGTRVCSIELAVPMLREGSYFPDWLLQPRRRARAGGRVGDRRRYLAGVSTRRIEKLVQRLSIGRESVYPLRAGDRQARRTYSQRLRFALCEHAAELSWHDEWLLHSATEDATVAIDTARSNRRVDLIASAKPHPPPVGTRPASYAYRSGMLDAQDRGSC
jgi:hypothetical protein